MSGWDRIRSSTRSQQGSSQNLSQQALSRTVTLGRVQPQAPAFRTIYCNDRDANYAHRYKGNSISTTKHNFFTFLPKGLYEQVKQDGFFPADILFLASTNADGVCYIETANLDGETNLKIRKALDGTWDYVTPEKACEFKGEVQCEQPNNSLYIFTGNLVMDNQTLPLSPNQILLKGCRLKNTELIVGVFLLVMEQSGVFIDRKYYFLGLGKSVEDQFNPNNRFLVALLTMLTLLTLYWIIIPISLYVSIEFFHNINKDLNMYHAETDSLLWLGLLI